MGRLFGFALLTVFSVTQGALAAGPYGGSVTALVLAEDGSAPRWAATERGLFRFGDGRWQRVSALAQRELRAAAETGGVLLVAEQGRGLLRSADEGASWQDVGGGLRGRYGHRGDDVRALVAHPGEPGRVYAGAAGQGVFESRDGGQTWRLLLAGLEEELPPAFHPLCVLPPAPGRPLLMGTDGRGLFAWEGERWRPHGEKLPEGLRVPSLAAAPGDPGHVVMGTRGAGLLESRDGGATWAPLRQGAYGVAGAVSIAGGGTVLAHFPEEGLVTAREGKAGRPEGLGQARVLALEALSGGGWLAGLAHDGVVEIGPQGEVGASRSQGLDATRVLALAPGAPPGAPGEASGSDGALWAGDTNGVSFTPGDGAPWEARDAGLLGAPVNALVWHGGQLYLGSGGQGVFRWQPQAGAWEPRSGGLGTSNTIFSLEQDADAPRLYVGTEGGVYASEDGGQTWTKRNRGLPSASVWMVAASPERGGVLWAGGGGRLFRSEDGGESWNPAGSARSNALAAGRYGREEGLWVLEDDRIAFLSDAQARTVFTAPSGERMVCLMDSGGEGTGTIWAGGSGGLWALGEPGGDARRVWSGAGVLSLLPTADGRLAAGTDGRGVVRFRAR
ncbi:MAG: hypothetical protein AB1578_03830 [Thermodesulfobacteriota bacterium]